MNPIGQAFPVINRAYAFSSYFDQEGLDALIYYFSVNSYPSSSIIGWTFVQ